MCSNPAFSKRPDKVQQKYKYNSGSVVYSSTLQEIAIVLPKVAPESACCRKRNKNPTELA